MNSTQEFVDLLCSGHLRVSTGLWLLPKEYLGHEDDEAHRLSLEPVDLRLRLLQGLEPGAKYASLSAEQIFRLVDAVSQERSDWSGALIYNLDLLIAHLNSGEQALLWQDLLTALPHRRRAVLLTMPNIAANLLPDEENIDLWLQENRLIGTIHI